MISEHEIAVNAACAKWHKVSGKWNDASVRGIIASYLSALPHPELPFEQAALYRKLVGMDDLI